MELITGAAGFIGSNLLKKMVELKRDVYAIDNLSTGTLSNISYIIKENKIKFRKIDVISKEFLKIKGNFSNVYHLASFIDARESLVYTQKYFDNIVKGIFNVLEFCRKRDSKIIFTSSAAVYGDYKRKVNENDDLKPISPYGAFKLVAESLIKTYHSIYGINYTILRLFNVYGKNARTGIIKILIEAYKEGKTVRIFGGDQKRDFVYVDDVINIILSHKKLNNDIFNVGTGKAYSVNSLVSLLEKLTGKKIKTKKLGKMKGDIDYSCADNRKIISRLKIRFTPLKEGLRLIL